VMILLMSTTVLPGAIECFGYFAARIEPSRLMGAGAPAVPAAES
jgi:hypothetical protein